jgi:AMP nucleosidase
MKNETLLTPAQAVDELDRLHKQAVAALRSALDRYVETRTPPTASERLSFRYPELRVLYHPSHTPHTLARPVARAYAKFQMAGLYATTVTQAEAFRPYLEEQLSYLVNDFGATLQVGVSGQDIPYPYVLEKGDELGQAGVSPAELAQYFPTPLLSMVGDEIAAGTWNPIEGEPKPLALFDAVRTDYSLKRLVHYTGTDWKHFQPWILLTNYHRYVDQFVRWGVNQLGEGSPYKHVVLPGGTVLTQCMSDGEIDAHVSATNWSRYQMPAYHLIRHDGQGITLINIGVGPSNAKNITDHLAVLRPHCWLMIGHCGGLRQSQRIGDYVLAHAYLRQDGILDTLVPPHIPIPALAEIQVALQEAAATITGGRGEALKSRLRTGTVVTNDDRNWELRWSQERRMINLSRAIGVDMESGTIAAQGYRLRVPYGTLLCVSDKPLHGEIKLPGAANAFYEKAVGEHLLIALAAVDLLRGQRASLHSRKLRSFDEPPFR